MLLMVMVTTRAASAETPPEYTAPEVVAKVREAYERVKSVRGDISRIIEMQGRDPILLNGTFAAVKPGRMRIETTGTSPQITTSDSRLYRIFFPERNEGVYELVERMSPMERYVKGPGHMFGDIMSAIEEGFTFSITDYFNDTIILRAEPVEPSDIAFILLGIAPESWTVRAVEQFDLEGSVASQTRYMDYHSGDSWYFPATVVITIDTGRSIVTETTYYRNVSVNTPIENDIFKNPGDSDSTWESITPVTKEQ